MNNAEERTTTFEKACRCLDVSIYFYVKFLATLAKLKLTPNETLKTTKRSLIT